MTQAATVLRRGKLLRGSCSTNGVLFQAVSRGMRIRVVSLGHVHFKGINVRTKYGGFRHLPNARRVFTVLTRRCTGTHNFSMRAYLRLVRRTRDLSSWCVLVFLFLLYEKIF